MSVVKVVFGPNGTRVRERRDPYRAACLTIDAIEMLDDEKKHALALHSLESSLTFDPDSVVALVNLAWLRTESSRFKDYQEAERLLKLALKLEPGNVHTLYNLGTLAMRRFDVDNAILNLTFVIKQTSARDSLHYDAVFNLATTYDRCGLFASAVKEWKRVLELRPNCPEANFIRFRILQHEAND